MPRIAGSNESVVNTYKVAITGAAGSTGVFSSTANPFGASVLVHHTVLRITTQSGAASTLDIGIGADATTSNDTQIDGLSGATAGIFNSVNNKGTNGGACQLWTTSTYLNVAEASGNVDGLVATLIVHYTLL